MNELRLNSNGPDSTALLTPRLLQTQNRRFFSTGGRSQENCCCGFLPAFADTQTGDVYLSKFADGRQAPMHLLDGLPDRLVIERSTSGRVAAIKETVQAGVVRNGQFYTREQAARATKVEH